MRYCSVDDFEKTIAQTMSTASPNPATLTTPGKLIDLGRKLNLNTTTSVSTYSLDDVYFYIRQGAGMIDAALSEQYVVPLIPVCAMETTLLEDTDEYGASLSVDKVASLSIGDQLVLADGTAEETIEIDEISGNVITPLDALTNVFAASGTRVLLVKFPEPIPFICAKLACAMFYDKWARAQSEPMKTEYGETLRKEAIAELNNIREGRTILWGIERIGTRFVNPNLYARYALKNQTEQDSTRADQRQ